MPRKMSDEINEDISPLDLIKEIEQEYRKTFKNDSMCAYLNYKSEKPKVWYPTGIITLDIALGGGLAGGRMSEVYGLPQGGKSTLLYSAIAATQERFPDKICVLADPENSAKDSERHMKLLGVDLNRLLYISNTKAGMPRYAEDIFEEIEWLLRNPKWSKRIAIIGIDSLGALVSRDEGLNSDKWDKGARVGGIAPAISMFLRNVVDSGLLYESEAHLLCLNQVRDDIGNMFNAYRTPGGKKVAHTAAQRIEVTRSRGQEFKNPKYDSKNPDPREPEYIGQTIKFKVTKNKVGGKEGATASIDFYYDYGLDVYGELLRLARHMGIIEGSGWMSMIDIDSGEVIAKYQGEKQWKQALAENPALWEKLNDMVYRLLYEEGGDEVEKQTSD